MFEMISKKMIEIIKVYRRSLMPHNDEYKMMTIAHTSLQVRSVKNNF
jgi:hypothetical protein